MKDIYKEIVSIGSDGWSKIMDAIPNPDMILRKTGTTYDGYRELLYDPHLWSCVQSRKSGVLSTDYDIVGEDSQLALELLSDIKMEKLIDEVLDSILYGFQPIEIYWTKAKGKIVPNATIAKPQELFYIDTNSELKYRPTGKTKGVSLPKYKFLDLRYRASYQNPYGIALLSKCYWPVKFKNGGIRFWVNFMERYGMPILIGKYTRGATQNEADSLVQHLANMTEDSVIVTPNDIDIEIAEPHRYSSVRLYNEMIKLTNKEISKAILSQTLTTDVTNGSKAAAETHYKIREELVLADKLLVEEAVNTLISYVAELNYGGYISAKFKFREELEDIDTRLDRDMKLLSSGAVEFTKEYWMEKYGYEKKDLVV